MHPLLHRDLRPIVGHRGNAAHAPENTLESFRQAVALGVDALELDVRLSADGEVVVHHDPTVARTTGGRGAVAALSWSELAHLDAGARFARAGDTPYRGTGVRIPRFAEVLEAFPDVPLLIELKVPEVARPLRRLNEAARAEARCIVASFVSAAMPPFAGSAIATGASQADLVRLFPRALLGRTAPALPYRVIAMPATHWGLPLPMAGFVRAAAGAGVPVHVWTVNDPAQGERLWAAGVRGLISDDPATMLALRARRFGAGAG
ncbi:MAG: glycerophosphodiester phosphodiesterase [Gemmatimonadota bacterium]